jgi:hypothetical protein
MILEAELKLSTAILVPVFSLDDISLEVNLMASSRDTTDWE